jgi:signal transduction histidine kinase
MPDTDWLRRHSVELGWAAFAAVNFAAMVAWPSWETVPFHVIWISLTLVYGFRIWGPRATGAILGVVIVVTGASIMADAFDGIQLWGELFEVPLMSAMFLAMVWHARRRQSALGEVEALLSQQERFLHDISHELRTPVTIAQGHLELLQRNGADSREIEIALDELGRIEGIIARLLLLAKAGHASFLEPSPIDSEQFLEDVFVRWADVAPRGWRLGPVAPGWVSADMDALRSALDALIENAVKYTEPQDSIELRTRVLDFGLVFDVIDSGPGIAPEKTGLIFDRFGRGDDARARATGGVGLGLAIVDAVAKAHGGLCTVQSRPGRTIFSLRVPNFRPVAADVEPASERGRAGGIEATRLEPAAAHTRAQQAEPPAVGRR